MLPLWGNLTPFLGYNKKSLTICETVVKKCRTIFHVLQPPGNMLAKQVVLSPVLISYGYCNNHKFPGLNQHKLFILQIFRPMIHYVLSINSRRKSVSFPFLASRDCLHSLAHGPYLHLQSQQQNIFVSFFLLPSPFLSPPSPFLSLTLSPISFCCHLFI